jgi:hypothetical protein
MRALISDTTKISELGFEARTGLEEGIDRYLDWIREQGDVGEYFTEAARRLRERQVVKQARSGTTV